MKESRTQKAKLNISTTLLRQLLATVCGIIIPKVMIITFGSVIYGATTSIAQFLSYISLLEGGIGRVARGALYKPLANGDTEQVSRIHRAVKSFFCKVGILFLVYTVILAVVYYDLAHITVFSRGYTAALVVAISLSTAVTYFSGIGNMTLMHADQKQYLTNIIITATNLLNTLFIVALVWLKSDVVTVKLVSSIVFIIRPILYSRYVKKNYDLPPVPKDNSALSQKWTGVGQHIAYFLHTNTDVVLLTLLADLKLVAVYSVYHLVVFSIWNIASSFSGGMEAAFGEMLAKKEKKTLAQSYGYYKFILTVMSLVLFGCAAVLIIPFIKLYLKDVTDADYIQPAFAIILLLAEYMNCLALPCTTLPIAANQLKRSRWGSYGESCINLFVSLALIRWNPLLGVALGTLCATVYKCLYYMMYSAKRILQQSIWPVMGKFAASITVMLVVGLAGMHLMSAVQMANFIVWCGWGCVVAFAIAAISLLYGLLVFPQESKRLWQKVSATVLRRIKH